MPRPLSRMEILAIGIPTALLALVGATACGGNAVRQNVFPDMDCESNSSPAKITYYGVDPGEVILLGHAHSDSHVMGDAEVTVTEDGKISASSSTNVTTVTPQIQAQANGAVRIISGDESFLVSAERGTGGADVTVDGMCITPAS